MKKAISPKNIIKRRHCVCNERKLYGRNKKKSIRVEHIKKFEQERNVLIKSNEKIKP